MTQLKFAHVGMGHLACANRVLAVIKPHTTCGKRYLKNAKETGHYIDATMGKTLKALLLLDDGSVMGSMITSKTLLKRLSGDDLAEETEDDTNENH